MVHQTFPPLVALAIVATCLASGQQTAVGDFQSKSVAAEANGWFGFEAYPGARELCSQVIRGQAGEEILWHSYATKDKPSQVAAFYVKANDGLKEKRAEVERAGDEVKLRRGDDVLSVQPSGSNHPQCGRKPDAAEATVIIVSRMSRPVKA